MENVTCDLCHMTGHKKRTCKSQGAPKGGQKSKKKSKVNAPSQVAQTQSAAPSQGPTAS